MEERIKNAYLGVTHILDIHEEFKEEEIKELKDLLFLAFEGF